MSSKKDLTTADKRAKRNDRLISQQLTGDLVRPIEYPDPFTGENMTAPAFEHISRRIIYDVMNGDKDARKDLLERTEGKVASKTVNATVSPEEIRKVLTDALREAHVTVPAEVIEQPKDGLFNEADSNENLSVQ